MSKTIAAAAMAALFCFTYDTAQAADIYSRPSFKDAPILAPLPVWTGFYGGIHLGTAWTDFGTKSNDFNGADVSANDSVSTTGIGGGQVGYNWQIPNSSFVAGIEADFDGIGGNNERGVTAVTYDEAGINSVLGLRLSQKGGFAGDVTGRLGYATANWLFYAKGGFAWFSPELRATAAIWDNNCVSKFSAENDGNLTGWTIGGGVEWKLTPNWSLKAEYLYYDFNVNNDSWNITSAIGNYENNWRSFSNDLTINTVKIGLNYHFTHY